MMSSTTTTSASASVYTSGHLLNDALIVASTVVIGRGISDEEALETFAHILRHRRDQQGRHVVSEIVPQQDPELVLRYAQRLLHEHPALQQSEPQQPEPQQPDVAPEPSSWSSQLAQLHITLRRSMPPTPPTVIMHDQLIRMKEQLQQS